MNENIGVGENVKIPKKIFDDLKIYDASDVRLLLNACVEELLSRRKKVRA